MPVPDTMKWVFDPVPPSGAKQGGVPAGHVFRPDLDVFVREVLQNSKDQKLPGSAAAAVRFTLERLSGADKDAFLAALNWHQLGGHISAASNGRNAAALRMRQALQNLQGEPLTILRIDDSGTQGLTGDEDGVGTNFNALCRNTLDTSEDRPLRGGSFGLGKAVLWRFSAFSTVLFSSRINDETGTRFRLFARTELPYHECEGRWSGPGWYGHSENTGRGLRAVSVWDDDALDVAKGARLFRPIQLGTGTSILVVGFQEPAEDAERPIETVGRAIVDSAARWFWPSICLHEQTLRVQVEAFDGREQVYQGEAALNDEIAPFVQAVSEPEPIRRAVSSGEVAESVIGFRVPARRPLPGIRPDPEVDATSRLRVIRGDADSATQGRINTVALIRGAGMVVQYRRPTRVPLDNRPFWGVLSAGLAAGGSPPDIALEQFLRAAEPPSHDDWLHTERIHVEYRSGARARIGGLWRELGNSVMELCDEEVAPTGEGPAALSRLFRMGGKGGGSTGARGFKVDRLKALLTRGVWSFEGRVAALNEEDGPWICAVSIWMDGETGRGERMRLDNVVAGTLPVRMGDDVAEVAVPAGRGEIEFRGGTVRVTGARELERLRRTRVRIEVLPRSGGAL